jgi:hypothetical protein
MGRTPARAEAARIGAGPSAIALEYWLPAYCAQAAGRGSPKALPPLSAFPASLSPSVSPGKSPSVSPSKSPVLALPGRRSAPPS